MVEEILIPHATKAFIDRSSEIPREILVVATRLPEKSIGGSEADARYEMMEAVGRTMIARRLHGYHIVWSQA